MPRSWLTQLRKSLGAAPLPTARAHFVDDYRAWVRHLIARLPLDEAMSEAVGGEFEWIGKVQRELVLQLGLRPDHHLVDVGCGAGRLASALRDYFSSGSYTGTDVVPELVDYARRRSPARWSFHVVDRLHLPVDDAQADFVVFFSVFTHLLLHESYCYLLEAQRVLKPGGLVVFSYLEFPLHWGTFEADFERTRAGRRPRLLNEFLSRAAIRAWATHLPMRLVEMRHGSKPSIEVDGRKVAFGQSVCVLEKL